MQRSVRENIALPFTTRFRDWGPIDVGGERREGRQGDRDAPDRHARRGRGPAPVGRQPAEGDDRALGRRRRPDDALLRPDPRHRHRHQAADLPAAPRPRRRGRGRPALHLGAQGDPARLRPGDRHLRRPGGRRDRRSPRPTSRPCSGPPTTCSPTRRCPRRSPRRRSPRARPRRQRPTAARPTPSRAGGSRRDPASATAATIADPRAEPAGRRRRPRGRGGTSWTLAPPRAAGRRSSRSRRLIQPRYGAAGDPGPRDLVLPIAFAAVAQAIVVISGGIDLSVGSMMALASVTSAVLMKGQGDAVRARRRDRRRSCSGSRSARSTAA